MANPPQPFRPDFGSIEIESFEHVPGGRELALLRLEGRYYSRLARPLLEATLLVDDGLAIHRHEPLPASTALDAAAGDDEWLWRAAFAVSLAALEDVELLGARPSAPADGGGGGSGSHATAVATLRVTVREAVLLTAAQSFAREIRLLVRPPGERRAGRPVAVDAASL